MSHGHAEFRLDRLTGEWVAVTGGRQNRPNLPATDCPFCVGGVEAREPYVVKAFTNRWPPLQEGGSIDVAGRGAHAGLTVPARGAAEVVLYSPDHDATLASVGAAQLRRVVDLWAERTQALAARAEVEYVLVFENRGEEVGATIGHPHGQIYGFPFIPPIAEREAAMAARFGCPLCAENRAALEDGTRIVAEQETFLAYTRFAAGWPFELLLVPRDHRVDLAALGSAERNDLAGLLGDVLGRYDRLFDAPLPYMLWLHPGVHVHLHLVTTRRQARVMRYVAAGEVGSGVMFNPVAPEEAASLLRAAMP